MRKLIIGFALLTTFGIAHAESGENQLFDCMDANSFEMNNQCVAEKISNSIHYREAETQVSQQANANFGEYAIATMTFNQEKMQIDVVAHRDALQVNNTLVMQQ